MNIDQIQQQTQKLYKSNMLFLQSTQFDLYKKITAFENAVENGFYTTRYELEYKREGYFDVMEKDTGKWLYNVNSYEHADTITQSIDFSKEDNLFETFRDLHFTDEAVAKYEQMDLIESSLATIAPIVHYTNQYADKTTTMKKIYKFIFFGAGLGLHLPKIHQKLQSNVYFIIEDDLELFYLSLFTCDYISLSNSGANLHFSIFEEEDEFRYKAFAFLRDMPIYNHYLKYFLLLSHSDAKIKAMHNVIISQDYLKFPHSAVLLAFLRPLDYLQNKFKFVNLNKIIDSKEFKQYKVLVLGAGPSLQKNIEWVHKNQEKFIIIAASAAMNLLEKNNIHPDILVHIDGFEASMKHLAKIDSIDYFNDSIKLFSTFAYPEFSLSFNFDKLYIFQSGVSIKDDYKFITASNVGIISCVLPVMFGAQDIYLLGLDMALDAKTGQTHLSDHVHSKELDINYKVSLEENINYHESVFFTKGNFSDEVPTTPNFLSSLMEIKGMLLRMKSSQQTIFNLSDGAAIECTVPLEVDTLQKELLASQNKTDIQKKLTDLFDESSTIGLTKSEIEHMKKRLSHAKNILHLLELFQKKRFTSMDIFHYELLGLFINILAEDDVKEAEDTNGVISLYIQMIGGYIFDFINTKELTNPKKHIKKLTKLLTIQMIKLVEYYKNYLENFIEEIEKLEMQLSQEA
jgi:hypothetical protein